jgi:hypothetical protein
MRKKNNVIRILVVKDCTILGSSLVAAVTKTPDMEHFLNAIQMLLLTIVPLICSE